MKTWLTEMGLGDCCLSVEEGKTNLTTENSNHRQGVIRYVCIAIAPILKKTNEIDEDESIALTEREDVQDERLILVITNLKLPSHSRLEEIYKHISNISNLTEEEFVVMKVAPQAKLREKEKTLDDLGLKSQETFIVQRVDQAGSLTEGHGTCR
ncbi:thioredoxin Y, chloroplastic-like [Paramuricea clavata]|uniref:Thioredoxin Y, chloroplastic-like n=1 Tax=Paramuricea clavata TaxID=317549 RepID=A0A7D9HTM0_PARCT|nr:thioredoxin Y, chloroplastic-like [Paramuricea clavata]